MSSHESARTCLRVWMGAATHGFFTNCSAEKHKEPTSAAQSPQSREREKTEEVPVPGRAFRKRALPARRSRGFARPPPRSDQNKREATRVEGFDKKLKLGAWQMMDIRLQMRVN
ncbi:hypothetical protein EYF80_025164 [Liparis tanakae]|uniref:Uncharacterized protein n=1 Tax=Liparis tanakae TaxID=230148 RepID=A0A4Z2HHB1_9TELE|nr:hypothetical protein EYF80_025164 [Liparis tanakae]